MEYTFKNTKTGKIESYEMKLAEYDEFKINNPHLERYHDTAPIFNYRGKKDFKTDNSFKEVMSKIADKFPGSPLADQHSKKSIKEVKTREVVNKHLNKKN